MYSNLLVISDNSIVCKKILRIIKHLQLPINSTFAVSPFSSAESFPIEAKVYNLKEDNCIEKIIDNYDLVISIHCKQLFPKKMFNNIKCINVHPGYNPVNRGWYPQVFAIIHDLKIGATIHEINNEIDNGPIIAREEVEKYPWDTSLSLYQRVIKLELKLFEENLSNIVNDNYNYLTPVNEDSNLYLKKDFNDLKKIDLNKGVTYGRVIDHLRALTHGDYHNAYFMDSDTGEKIFLKIELKREKEID